MSRQVKYCPVCAKAGMPEEVYSSHYVRESRDPASRVTCPLIKHNKCGECGKTGHFSSSCRVTKQVVKKVVKVEKQKISVANRFAFDSESDSEGEESKEDEVESDVEPEKTTKKRRIFKDEGMVAEWQNEFAYMFMLNESERNNGRVYWDKSHGKIVKKKYEIVDMEEGSFLRYNPSWASEDEYEEED